MKKLLALVLAMVMTLGLATVSSSAAYSDAADVSFDEAVDVMSAVGVFQGADGKFSPKANLNREQAAKLIAYLDLGETTAEALPAVKVFSDVPATSWSAKYIAYCADAGYIAGDGTGKFNPAGELNGYAFGKMILCVLGYDANIEGFTGNNWSIAVAKLMESNKIADGVSGAASATLTREQAAQYCLNALKATTVKYTSKGTNVTINGAVIATGASAAEAVKEAASLNTDASVAISGDFNNVGDYTVQLGEKLYKGKLSYTTAANGDDFGRAAKVWKYKTDTVGTYATETPDYTFVASKAYAAANNDATVLKAMQDATGNKKLAFANTNTFYINGVSKTAGANNGRAFAIGDTVEVYLDGNTNNIANVVVSQYALTKLATAKAASGAKDSNGDAFDYTLSRAAGKTFTALANTDFPGYDAETYKKDAIIAVAVNGNNKVIASYVPSYTTGAISALSGSKVTLGGTGYTFYAGYYNPDQITTANVDWKNGEYGVYTDANGYAMGLDVVSATAALTEVYYVNDNWTDSSKSFGANVTKYYIQAVALDGTKATFELKDSTSATTAAEDTFVTLKKSGDVYEATEYTSNSTYYVAKGQTQSLTSKSTKTSTNPFSSKAAYLTSATQYVVLEKDGKDLKASVLTGGVTINGATTGVIATKDSNGNYEAAYVVVNLPAAYAGTISYDDLLYVKSASSTQNGSSTYAVDVYNQKGEKSTITADSAGVNNTFFKYSVNSDGEYTLTPVTTNRADNLSTGAWDKDKKGVAYDEVFAGVHGTQITFGSFTEVEMKDVVVVDLHDADAAGQYEGTVASIADIYTAADTVSSATSSNFAVKFDVSVNENGGVVLFVTDIQ